jgi:hypothetical protein
VAVLWPFIRPLLAHPLDIGPFNGAYPDTPQKQKVFPQPKRRLHMPRGKRTSIPQAAQAKALADIGYQGTQIADATGLPVRTVDDIINGRNGWREIIANDPGVQAVPHPRQATNAGGLN